MDKIAAIDDVYLEQSCHRWISIIVLEDSINLINFIDQPWISTERTLNRGARLPDPAGMETVRPSISGILGWTAIALLFRFATLEPECVPAPPPSDFDLPCGTRTRVLVVVPFTHFFVFPLWFSRSFYFFNIDLSHISRFPFICPALR
jgi:hypothetical protein